MISAIRKTTALQKAVNINGNTIRARAGASLWPLPNGSYDLVTDSDSDDVKPLASQATFRPLPNGGLYFAICMCLLRGGNDDCKFDGGYKKENCKGQACCGFHEGEVSATGAITIY